MKTKFVIFNEKIQNYYEKHLLNSTVLWTAQIGNAYTFPTEEDCLRYIRLTLQGYKELHIVEIDTAYTAYDRAMRGI